MYTEQTTLTLLYLDSCCYTHSNPLYALMHVCVCESRTGLKARAGAAWVPVSSRYFSHEKLFGCLHSEEKEKKDSEQQSADQIPASEHPEQHGHSSEYSGNMCIPK